MSGEQKQSFLASGTVLSIAEAAKLTPYTAEYLSLLARQGKLTAVKIARNWVTTRESIAELLNVQGNRHRKLLEKIERAERRVR